MKYLFVSTISNTINSFLVPHIKMLIEQGHTVDVVCKIEQPIKEEVYKLGCRIYEVPFSRSVLKNNYKKISSSLKSIIEKNQYDVIHTHTPIASAIVRLVARNFESIKVIYTAHGFHFYKGAPLLNWITFYPVERFLSKYTDILITINKEDYERAKKFKHTHVEYVPGVGFDIDRCNADLSDNEKVSKDLRLENGKTTLLSVGELNDNKNHQVVIEALSQINPNQFRYIICGVGPNLEKLANLIETLNLEDSVFLEGYRDDIPRVLKKSDIFIFPSYREGLPVSLMEAMASGLPVICSNIRGNVDLIDNRIGGIIVSPSSTEEMKSAILELFADQKKQKEFGLNNMEKVKEFSTSEVLKVLSKIYSDLEVATELEV